MDSTLTVAARSCRRTGGYRFSAACALPAVPLSVPVLRRLAQHTARRWGIPQGTVDALGLIVTELASNAVRHSGSPDVTMRLCAVDGELTVQIADSGSWRPGAVPSPGTKECDGGNPECGGRGLLLVEAYAANCTVHAMADGTTVTAALHIPARPLRPAQPGLPALSAPQP